MADDVEEKEDEVDVESIEEEEIDETIEATDANPPTKPGIVSRAYTAVARLPSPDPLSMQGVVPDDDDDIAELSDDDEDFLFSTEHPLIDTDADHTKDTLADEETMDYLTNPNWEPKPRGKAKYSVGKRSASERAKAKQARDKATDEFLFGTKGIY